MGKPQASGGVSVSSSRCIETAHGAWRSGITAGELTQLCNFEFRLALAQYRCQIAGGMDEPNVTQGLWKIP